MEGDRPSIADDRDQDEEVDSEPLEAATFESGTFASLAMASPEQSKSDGRLDPLVGTVLAGRYEVLRRIGEGGMGAVYEARHTVIDKRVAVKVLLERLVEKRELVGRLLKEARLASAIGHENIVDVTDFGTTEDARSFVVMEYLDGEPLSALLAREAPLPAIRCLHIIGQVASALEAAHAKGIVHRDIKPENIFLIRRGDDDFVKVVDFGVSKAVRTADEGPDTLRLTRTGTLFGTPLYMSPEQARGADDIDERADIWAVGVVFYECLTGEVPFRANNYLQVIAQVLNSEAMPPSRMLPELGIPAAVEAVVMKALAKDRNLRYQRMTDLLHDLERLKAGDHNVTLGSAAAPASGELQRVGTRWHLGIVAVILMGAGVAFSLTRSAKDIGSFNKVSPIKSASSAKVAPQELRRKATVEVQVAPVDTVELRAPRPVTPPVRARRLVNPKAANDGQGTPLQDGSQTSGPNIRVLGDDVAPSADKVFGKKAVPDGSVGRGAK